MIGTVVTVPVDITVRVHGAIPADMATDYAADWLLSQPWFRGDDNVELIETYTNEPLPPDDDLP